MTSLRTQVAVAVAAATASILLVGGLAVVRAIGVAKLDTLDRRLEHSADNAIQDAFGTSVHGTSGPRWLDADGAHGWLYSARTGRVVRRSESPFGLEPAPLGFSTQEARGRRWRVHVKTSSVSRRGWGRPTLLVAMPIAPIDAEVGRARRVALLVVAFAALLAGVLAWCLTTVALAPMRRLVDGALDLSWSEDLSRRLPVGETTEVGSLARSLNVLLDRGEQSLAEARSALAATRSFTADAGHELRTPLTSLRANLDVLSRDGLGTEDRERSTRDALLAHARLAGLIDSLQVLARGDAAVGDRSEAVVLARLAEAAVADARRRHPDVAFELAAEPHPPIAGDPDGLRILLDNLLENAARYGGRRVRVGVHQGDRHLRLSVEDDGPGIPDAEKARVFDRFARGSTARTGTGSGLGLAIAAQQAELHGGRLRLDDSPLGGARFELTLSAPSTS